MTIKAAAQASWKQSNTQTRAMIKGRNGFMETKIITGFEAGGDGKALVQVKNLTDTPFAGGAQATLGSGGVSRARDRQAQLSR